ncbi:MAG TPA: hypothetical protein P5186_19910 [Candidatus Paceibacterota bacterium]|nr:hypothetical protein [Verrucomicrobiota bacterium]HRY50325.1 hypothetical protein [Candidatus Paceibacterota bacterium]
MSRSSTASVNIGLTNFARGVQQDRKQSLADFLAPVVKVAGASGQYKDFNDANAFTVYATDRALGGDAQRIAFSAADQWFNCRPQALEVTIDQAERDQAGNSSMADAVLTEGKVVALLNAQTLSHEKKVIDYIVANTTPVADRGNWSNEDIDPIDQLDEQLDQMSLAVGSTDDFRMALSVSSWRILRNHPKVKARCSGVQVGGISLKQLQEILIFPVEVRLGILATTGVKMPAVGTKARVLGSNVVITYAMQNPTVYDPSGFKTFTVAAGYVDSVRSWTDASGRFEVHAVDWSEDIKQTSTESSRRLVIT